MRAAFPHEETRVDVAHIVRNNIYLYGIRGEGKSATHRAEAFMAQKRFDASKCIPTPSRSTTCQQQSVTRETGSMMRSKWW